MITAATQRAQARSERALAVIFGLLSASVLRDLALDLIPEASRAWRLAAHVVPLALIAAVIIVLLRIERRSAGPAS